MRVGRKSGDVTVRAPRVISGAGLYNTFERLLPKHVASKSYYADICSNLKVGSSINSVKIHSGLTIRSEKMSALPVLILFWELGCYPSYLLHKQDGRTS